MDNLRIRTLVLGPVSTNCYIIYDDIQKRGIIVDPAADADRILQECGRLQVTPEAVLLTHGHFDHMMAAEELRGRAGVKIYAAEKEAELLADSSLNLSRAFVGKAVELRSDVLMRDGDVLTFAGGSWKVLETPGHTAGSVCFYLQEEDVLLSGDTLFQESLGRTDFPTSNSNDIMRSIRKTLFALPGQVMVYPGHGEVTTIEHEMAYNPVSLYNG